MGDTRIILISRRGPLALLQRFQRGLGSASGKAGRKLHCYCEMFKEKRNSKKV